MFISSGENGLNQAVQKLIPSFHVSFLAIYEKIQKWNQRFPFSSDKSIFNDLILLFLLTSKQYLDQRDAHHLFRLVLSMSLMQKKILRMATISSHSRHLQIRWFSTDLSFPFCSKRVYGLLIGFNVTNRYEIFDEENILLALQKYLPELRLVKDSFYTHASSQKNVKIFYLELEKQNGQSLSFEELSFLKMNIEEKVQKCIQTLSPDIFMRQTQEEIYKNIIVLSKEISCLQDLPQVYISFETQTDKEIVFKIILVQISPFHTFSLKDCFLDCKFVLHRHLTVRTLEEHPIEAFTFSLYLPRGSAFLRSDGSLNFYIARQKVVDLLNSAIGEFRDYNGGIIIKQQEQLYALKKKCHEEGLSGLSELLENFFYELSPLENQIVFPIEKLYALFQFFIAHRKEIIPNDTHLISRTSPYEGSLLMMVQANDRSLLDVITLSLQENPFGTNEIAYNFINLPQGLYFNCLIISPDSPKMKAFLSSLQNSLDQWVLKKKKSQTLTIAMGYSIVSLDPRVGGEEVSSDVLRLLFEGLTRFNQSGSIEYAVAKSISVSPCGKHYTFRLRRSFWNDGSLVTAYDFEYAWKKILSPQFKTNFAYFFYPIKNALEAKQGKVSLDDVGIHVVDDLTLKIDLVNPIPYFLQLTAHRLYSPVHRFIDQEYPQWPQQSEQHYPCNGPFQLKMNRLNQGFKLVKNPLYLDAGQITLEEITLTLMSPSQAFQAFQNNEVDWIGNPLGSWQPFFNPGKDDQIITLPNNWVCWAVFNSSKPPFNHRKLRQAFSYAIERSLITTKLFSSISPAYSPLLSQSRSHPDTLFPKFDQEHAERLLCEALDEMNLKREELPPISLIFQGQGILEHAAVSLRQQFKECLGVNCELQSLPWNNVFNYLTTGNYQMGLVHWTSPIEDPIYTLSAFTSTLSSTNFPKWHHDYFERLIQLSEQETNPYQRSVYLLEAQKILCSEMPIVPLFYQSSQALIKKSVEVLFKSPNGPFDIARTKLKE